MLKNKISLVVKQRLQQINYKTKQKLTLSDS